MDGARRDLFRYLTAEESADYLAIMDMFSATLLTDLSAGEVTGQLAERGADLEIHVPNPFAPASPWIIAVQVKDYVATVGVHVAEQLEQAITSRQGTDAPGRLVAVVLASVGASPSPELVQEMDRLSKHYGVSVSCVHGEDLMRVIARGLLAGHRAAS